MDIKLNLLKEIKSAEVYKLNKQITKIKKKIELSNISLSINEKTTLGAYWIDSAVSIVLKDYF